MKSYYAKPYAGLKGTYDYHIGQCHRLWREMRQRRWHGIEFFCNELNIPTDEFCEKVDKAIAFHDAGKLLPTFQQQMQRLVSNQKADKKLHFRHELASALLLLIMEWEKLKANVTYIPCEILAVLGHHKQLYFDWHKFQRDLSCPSPPGLDEAAILKIVEVAKYHGVLCEMDVAEAEKVFLQPTWSSKLKNGLNERLKPTNLSNISAENRRNIRLIYSLVKGILLTCDWLSSAENDRLLPLHHNTTSNVLLNKIKTKVTQEGREYEKRPFHDECKSAQGNVLAIAPTGSGKTEAALLWATNDDPTGIIFLMPTMVTSNSLYERFVKNYFDEKECGLVHSSADTYFAQQNDFDNDNDNDNDIDIDIDNTLSDFRLLLQQFKAFMAPVMVATVDQLLTCGFNIGLWCQKEWALVGSRVIFDEIHAYQHYTLGLITATIEKIKLLGGKVCIMSATMPNFLRRHFQNVLGVEQIVVAEELMQRRKCNWHYSENQIDEMDEEIATHLHQGKKVAIVFNTVHAAQKAYCKWAKLQDKWEILCYHSQFIMKHRQEKEHSLRTKDDQGRPKEYNLVIATQAIEVSLDISFDVIYSECAPLDSLIQRAGRCNRYNKMGDYHFIVFPASDVAKKYVYKEATTVLDRTEHIIQQNQKKLSENELNQMLEYVYEGISLDDNNENYKKGYNLQGKVATAIDSKGFIFDLPINEDMVTREFTDNLKVSIIPHAFYGEVEKLCQERKYCLLHLYEVGIMEYRRKKLKPVPNDMHLPIYEIPYTEKEGVLNEENDILARLV